MKIVRTAAIGFVMLSAACATIMQGSKQGVSINSNPAGATVKVDGQAMGTTPAVVQLSRKGQHVVSLELDGYEPYQVAFSKHASGWVWGNLVFGGLIGLAVDAGTGGLYKLSPDQVSADMHTKTAMQDGHRVIQVAVVLHADPSWQKIGQLQPVGR